MTKELKIELFNIYDVVVFEDEKESHKIVFVVLEKIKR